MRVEAIACLSDNYAYLIELVGAERQAIVVDPSEEAPVSATLDRLGLGLRAIFCTHHHPDHVGGVVALAKKYDTKLIYGYRGDADRIDGLTHLVDDGQTVRVGSVEARVLHVPAHTRGAIAFVVRDLRDVASPDEAAWVFTGDTLFLGGCGRLFEGSAADMHRSLNVVLGALPGNTKVACGHEYTLANLRFAAHVEPENRVISERIRYVQHLRDKGLPSVPGTITAEHTTNPFMRLDEEAVRRHVALATEDPASLDPVEVLRRLREEKNSFR